MPPSPTSSVSLGRSVRHRPTHRASRAAPRVRVVLGAAALATAAVVGLGYAEQHGLVHTAAEASGSTTTTTVHLGSVAASAALVTCWDDHQALASQCSRPQTRSGLTTVFPSLASTCRPAASTPPHADEAYLCRGDGYVVRYTRWQPGFDRFSVFSRIAGTDGTTWRVRGRFAGRTWTADRHGAARWTATYRSDPYSVTVLADDEAARAAGVRTVRAVPPGRIGRR